MFLRGKRRAEAPPEPAQQRQMLEEKLQQIDEALAMMGTLQSGVTAASTPATTATGNGSSSTVVVSIGNSKMAREIPDFVEAVTNMVNKAYGYMRIDEEDIMDRLQMGDPGSSRSNRVLHIAFIGKRPVGCMSSTFRVPWAEDGCGHWGLLVVDVSMQGKGIASAMVAAAESRLAGMCEEIQMEYEFTPGDALSERLYNWYEGKCGFRCVSGPPSRRRSEFRKCRKKISEAEQNQGRRQRLTDMRAELVAELAALQGCTSECVAGPHSVQSTV